jgi:hypothetical protein
VVPSAGARIDLGPAQPGADRVTSSSAPSAHLSPSGAAGPSATPAPGGLVLSSGPVGVPSAAPPAATTAPASPATPPAGAPLDGTRGSRPLVATLTHSVDQDGVSGYAGRIEMHHPARRPATNWQVSLVVPGGNAVYGDDASVVPDGEQVTFGGGPLPAGVR